MFATMCDRFVTPAVLWLAFHNTSFTWLGGGGCDRSLRLAFLTLQKFGCIRRDVPLLYSSNLLHATECTVGVDDCQEELCRNVHM